MLTRFSLTWTKEFTLGRATIPILSCIVLATGCGGKVDICGRAAEYVARCTGRGSVQPNCQDSPEVQCEAECIVDLEPPCVVFTSLDANAAGANPKYLHCIDSCRQVGDLQWLRNQWSSEPEGQAEPKQAIQTYSRSASWSPSSQPRSAAYRSGG